MSYAQYFQPARPKSVPQTKPIKTRQSVMVKNDGGGYSFKIDCWTRLERFLILGCEGGHFQVGEQKLTIDNAQGVIECLRLDPVRAISLIVEISETGRAPKNAPAVFALALAAAVTDEKKINKIGQTTSQLALFNLPNVCRIYTDLADFIQAVTTFRGWGRGLRRAVAAWYNDKPVDKLCYQMTKYRDRNGFSHRDVLRLAHPNAGADFNRNQLYKYGVGKLEAGDYEPEHPLGLICGMELAKTAMPYQLGNLIRDYGLVREHLPTEALNSTEVWEALLEKMPATALVRNLGKMSNVGLLKPLSSASTQVCSKLRDEGYLRAAKVHPFSLLLALTTYKQGRGVKGELTWKPVPAVVGALEDAFYSSFNYIEPTGKRHFLAIDVSGSMSWASSTINNTHITARVGAACMSMVTLRSEEQSYAMAFADGMDDLGLTPSMSLDGVIRKCEHAAAGGTDCSAPMRFAIERRIPVDVFVVYTDNDTNSAQSEHPIQALDRYRQVMGIPAKLAVVAMCSNGHSIADPNDSGTLDIAGFDANCPALLAEFAGYSMRRAA